MSSLELEEVKPEFSSFDEFLLRHGAQIFCINNKGVDRRLACLQSKDHSARSNAIDMAVRMGLESVLPATALAWIGEGAGVAVLIWELIDSGVFFVHVAGDDEHAVGRISETFADNLNVS